MYSPEVRDRPLHSEQPQSGSFLKMERGKSLKCFLKIVTSFDIFEEISFGHF